MAVAHLFFSLVVCPLCGRRQVPEEDARCAASKDASPVVRASFSLFHHAVDIPRGDLCSEKIAALRQFFHEAVERVDDA